MGRIWTRDPRNGGAAVDLKATGKRGFLTHAFQLFCNYSAVRLIKWYKLTAIFNEIQINKYNFSNFV